MDNTTYITYTIVGLCIQAVILWIIVASMAGGNTCGEGYHVEEDFRGTISGCVSN